MTQDDSPAIRLAKTILDFNWTGGYTKPGPRLYPHQWSWDSALIAIGYAHYDQDRAAKELNHLLESQWKGSLLPHEVHDPRLLGKDPGGLGFWNAEGDPRAPDDRQTSGEAQPPVHATAARYVYKYADDEARAMAFLEEAFPRLERWHEYLHRERGPEDEGLVYIRHPWETGMDNSPMWDSILQRIQLEPDQIPEYHRGYLQFVPAGDRPSDAEYDRYAYLVKLFADRDYDEARIREDCLFLVQEALFNALLCQSNRDLADIARILDEDASPFEDRAEQTSQAMNRKLWDEEHATYLDFDLVDDRSLRVYTTPGFLPLFAGIPDEDQARRMVEALKSPCYGLGDESVKAVAGYDRCGYEEQANHLRRTILDLVENEGFHEYFEPASGRGHGSGFFSWTAALYLDVALEDRDERSGGVS